MGKTYIEFSFCILEERGQRIFFNELTSAYLKSAVLGHWLGSNIIRKGTTIALKILQEHNMGLSDL